jgi:hypothetical protein
MFCTAARSALHQLSITLDDPPARLRNELKADVTERCAALLANRHSSGIVKPDEGSNHSLLVDLEDRGGWITPAARKYTVSRMPRSSGSR